MKRSIRAGCSAALLIAIAFLAGAVNAQTVPPAARSELAPGGKLRVGLIVTNSVFITKDGPAAEIQGVAADLGRELAKQLGATFEPVRYDSAAKIVDGAKSGEWDVAFLGYDKERGALMDFSAPYLELGSSYLVAAGSPIKTMADVDMAGRRIGTADRSAQERYLTGALKQAELVRIQSSVSKSAAQLLASGKVHAVAGNRVTLMEVAAKVPGLRVLEGQFAPLHHVLAVPKGKPAGSAYAREYIERAKASGSVQQAIQRAELRGVNVAAAAAAK